MTSAIFVYSCGVYEEVKAIYPPLAEYLQQSQGFVLMQTAVETNTKT
jgi:hypothetical protein